MPEIHTELDPDHLKGNGGRGRLIYLPGSAGRAREIYEHFHVQEGIHPAKRAELTSYFGRLQDGEVKVDVCALGTGMGCPSINIVLGELIKLGGREFIRVGTAGSFREYIKVGDVVIVREAYKEEHTSRNYLPFDWPARAHPHALRAAVRAAERLGYGVSVDGHPKAHIVTAHVKDDLWEEDFPEEYRRMRNPYRRERVERIMAEAMERCESTSMEESVLYIVVEEAGIAELVAKGRFRWEDLLEKRDGNWSARPPRTESYWSQMRYKAVAIDAIVGDREPFADPRRIKEAEEAAIRIAIQTGLELYKQPPSGGP